MGEAQLPGLEPPFGRIDGSQSLWSAWLTVGQVVGGGKRTGFSIYEGLGALSSGGFALDRSHFSVLKALQREDGFVLEVAGIDELPGGFTLELHAASGDRIARLSSCDSLHSSGALGHRFFWPQSNLHWKHWRRGESASIAIRRSGRGGELGAGSPGSRNAIPFARFERVPKRHSGKDFDLRLRLLNRGDGVYIGFAALALQVTSGVVRDLKRLPGSDDLWHLTVSPDGRQAVGIRVLADSSCDSGTDCDSARVARPAFAGVVVPGPPLSAKVVEVPAHHSGLPQIAARIEFSESLRTHVRNLVRRALDTNGTPLEGVRRIDGRDDLVEVILAPDSGDHVEIAIDPEQVCVADRGGCRDDLQRLSDPLALSIPPATVHLVFDDGPHPVYTPQILDILSYYSARATFFVTGVAAKAYPALIQRIVNEGHTLGNHTWNHDMLAGMSRSEFDDTVTRTQVLLGEHATPCLRPPNYSIDEHTAQHAARLGLRLIMGTVRTNDWMLPGADVIAGRIFAGTTPNAVIVLHDGGGDRSQTVEGLRDAMWNLRTMNYAFEPVCRPHRPAYPQFAPVGMGPTGASVPMPPLGF